jgi:hypothetical protein
MGCGCKGNGGSTPQPTQTTTTTTSSNQLDEQRVAQVKSEIRNIVNKYYNDGRIKK